MFKSRTKERLGHSYNYVLLLLVVPQLLIVVEERLDHSHSQRGWSGVPGKFLMMFKPFSLSPILNHSHPFKPFVFQSWWKQAFETTSTTMCIRYVLYLANPYV